VGFWYRIVESESAGGELACSALRAGLIHN
jgi:hypothetical protein